MLNEKSYKIDSFNKFFKDAKLKKKYMKELNNMILNINKYKSNTVTGSYKPVKVIIDISFKQTNTLLNIMDFSGNLKFFRSAGLLKYKGKRKKSRFKIVNNFYKILLSKFKFSRFIKKPLIALHLKNTGRATYWIRKRFKKKFNIRIFKSFNLYPYNGCRKKKVPRKKFKKKK